MNISITKKDYFWSYASYFLKFGINLLLFPLVLNMLSSTEYGLWVTFSSIGTIINLFDFGFSSTILRNLAYVWGGAKSLQREGCGIVKDSGIRDDRLFVLAFMTCRRIYSVIALLALVTVSTVGLVYIIYVMRSFWCIEYIIAWIIYGANICINLYYAYITVSLRAIGAIEQAQKATVIGYLVQIVIAYAGILAGWGLIALSIAGCLCGLVMRIAAKYYLNRYENVGKIIRSYRKLILACEIKDTFKIFWYNAKKAGISSIATVAMTQSTTLLCSAFLGVSVTGEYGVCYQILTTLSGVAQIQYQTVMPKLIQERLINHKRQQVKLFSSSVVFSWIIFLGGAIVGVICGDYILTIIGSHTSFNHLVFLLLTIIMFGELNYSLHASYISLANKLPFVKSVVITSVVTIMISILGLELSKTIWTLLFARCVIEGAYIFWKWPKLAHLQLGINTFSLVKEGIYYWISLVSRIVKRL